jgi:hypothetical protein
MDEKWRDSRLLEYLADPNISSWAVSTKVSGQEEKKVVYNWKIHVSI